MNREPAIDADGFASLVEMIGPDSPEVVVEILDTYSEESTHLLESIVDCAAAGDVEEMLRPVHSLKSSSASVGALCLSAICAELEQHLRGFGPEVNVNRHVTRMGEEYTRAEAELATLRSEYASM